MNREIKPKRDPEQVSLAWLAYWALEGDEDIDFVRQYAAVGRGLVGRVLRDGVGSADREGLVDLILYLAAIEQALSSEGANRIALVAEPRKSSEQGGRRRLSFEEVLRRRKAAGKAYRYYRVENLPKPEAIKRAWQDMQSQGEAVGLSERIISDWLDYHRRIVEGTIIPA